MKALGVWGGKGVHLGAKMLSAAISSCVSWGVLYIFPTGNPETTLPTDLRVSEHSIELRAMPGPEKVYSEVGYVCQLYGRD